MNLEQRSALNSAIKNFIGNEEVWAFHPRFDLYLFSNKGRIKNIITNKILKDFPNRQGYRMINVKYSSGIRRCSMVHKLILEAFNYIHNNIYETNHIDGNKNNNVLLNLEWLTRQENLQHARDNKLFKSLKGEQNGNCKLSRLDIVDIKELKNLGFTIISIAKSYNMDRNYISKIVNNKARME